MSATGSPTDRIICPQCGGNNFPTQAACWRCGAPLNRAQAAAPPQPPSPAQDARSAALRTPPPANVAAAVLPASTGPSTLAVAAAVALAFFFPLVAVPTGFVFLMLDDRRRVQIGWIAIIAGIAFMVLHIFLTGLMVKPMIDYLLRMLPGTRPPSMDSPVPPLSFPQ